jgi:tripartite motif-containing protein 2/3
LEGSLADLYTSCEFVEKALTHGSETEILLVKKQVEERLQEYGKMQVVKTPAENSYLIFDKGNFSLPRSSIHYQTLLVDTKLSLYLYNL